MLQPPRRRCISKHPFPEAWVVGLEGVLEQRAPPKEGQGHQRAVNKAIASLNFPYPPQSLQ